MTPISTKLVINHQVNVHEVEELSETPGADPAPEDLHQDSLVTMAHDSLSQTEISDSSDVAQLFSVNKSTTHKHSKCTVKVHTQYGFTRAHKSATQLINRGANGDLVRSDMCMLQETS